MLLAVVLSGGVTACGSDEPSDPATAPQATGGQVPQSLSHGFRLLRTPPDGIPAEVRRTLQVPVAGMRWDLARRVPVPLPGGYWLAPGARDLCVVATSPDSPAVGTVCASAGQALRSGIANTAIDQASGRRVIVGVAPDGARSVLVRTGRSTASARVNRHGGFVLSDAASAPPDTLMPR